MGPNSNPAKVLVVAGTHGNERNGPWLLEHWRSRPGALQSHGLELELVLGNPAAHAQNRRYLERDLNRCFAPSLLADASVDGADLQRARELLLSHGPAGEAPCLVVLDLHSTTSAMGNALVVYGRRPADLALAAGVQGLLGLPIYLHEADQAQTGFLVESWPCGLVIEVGPVPQGVIQAQICRQTQLGVEAALEVLAAARRGPAAAQAAGGASPPGQPRPTPRRGWQPPAPASIPRQHRDWQPLQPGDPLFLGPGGATLPFVAGLGSGGPARWPVFINEAAYGEKGIAMSLTGRDAAGAGGVGRGSRSFGRSAGCGGERRCR